VKPFHISWLVLGLLPNSALRGEDPHAERLKDLIRSFLFMYQISQYDANDTFDAFILGLGFNPDVDINFPQELVLRNSRQSELFNHDLCNFKKIDSQNKHEDFASFLAGAGFKRYPSR
jgi:hypothetical protein